MMRGGNREMRRMMDKMGLDMNELQNVQEVIIKEVVIAPIESGEQDLSTLKKADLVEIAQRLGFSGEITNAITKAILIEFINKN